MSNEPLERAVCPLCGRLIAIFTPTDRDVAVFCGHRIAHAKNGGEGTPWCQGGGRVVGERTLNAQTPPYIDLHERGSYDTDELDALEAATRPEPTPEVVTDDTA